MNRLLSGEDTAARLGPPRPVIEYTEEELDALLSALFRRATALVEREGLLRAA
jgi:hypothetical protein